MRSILISLLALTIPACATSEADPEAGSADIVGGKAEARFAASGYLASGPSMTALDVTKPACGATLIAPNVAVTAAHCVVDRGKTFAFGAGDLGESALVRVSERVIHPDFHAEAQGAIDLTHALRKHDVALLVLERDVEFAEPAQLATEAPSSGCTLQAIGYHAGSRVSAPACVMFKITLGTDPIFEVHPDANSALCVADGDEGSAVVTRGAEKTSLVGIYVGSVTQGLTDCVRGSQFLDGYESIFGYREFLNAGIARARSR